MKSHPLLWDGGVYFPQQHLWLDPVRRRQRAVISHAHDDHVASHDLALATRETALLVNHRRRFKGTLDTVAYHASVDWGDARITLYPAGHVLGAAQVLVETDFGRVLYTGDLKLRRGRTAEPAVAVEADVLILESTFGRPHYCFPDSDLVIEALIAWCLRTIDEGFVPVLLGYSLGKGQEILSVLADHGLPIYLHPSLASVTDVYRRLGCPLPGYTELGDDIRAPAVVIAPPTARRPALLASIRSARTAALSGWAMDQSFKHRLEVDAVFPLSDHADFQELCAYAIRVNAQTTYTVLGFDEELALHLRQRGLRALPLRQADQLTLF